MQDLAKPAGLLFCATVLLACGCGPAARTTPRTHRPRKSCCCRWSRRRGPLAWKVGKKWPKSPKTDQHSSLLTSLTRWQKEPQSREAKRWSNGPMINGSRTAEPFGSACTTLGCFGTRFDRGKDTSRRWGLRSITIASPLRLWLHYSQADVPPGMSPEFSWATGFAPSGRQSACKLLQTLVLARVSDGHQTQLGVSELSKFVPQSSMQSWRPCRHRWAHLEL